MWNTYWEEGEQIIIFYKEYETVPGISKTINCKTCKIRKSTIR